MVATQTDTGQHHGLKTAEALRRLYLDVKEVLSDHEASIKTRWPWLKEAFHHSSKHSRLCWISAVLLFASALVLLFGSLLDDNFDNHCCLMVQGILILVLLVVNMVCVVWDSQLRHHELYRKALDLVAVLRRCSEVCHWKQENYPHLCSPYSPCITLQWTYRDSRLVNLPWALLVTGDTVMIRPGQPAPGHCTPLTDKDCPELRRGEVYSPPPNVNNHDSFTAPSARIPLPAQVYVMRETPYLRNLRQALCEATQRPDTFHDKERHILVTNCVEQFALPLILILVLVINSVRYVYVSEYITASSAYEMLLLVPVTVVLPLLPLIIPVAWLLINSYGNARLAALQHSSSEDSTKNEYDPFEETDFAEKKTVAMQLSFSQLKRMFLDILLGRHNSLPRSANLLHVLGSVTALCCVDKKGILSWPNPTAEKVFFLRSSKEPTPTASDSGVEGGGLDGGGTEPSKGSDGLLHPGTPHHKHHHQESQTIAEVLDLTHDNACPFRLQFDDTSWGQHLKSLKPLGLAILLNTCNMDTQDHYTQFCSHVTCEALYNEDLVPVANRSMPFGVRRMNSLTKRCLCELAKQIGFSDGAPSVFTLYQQLSTFRHVQPETVRRDIKFARTLALATKLKFPFPHMVAVVVKDKSNHNNLQLFSQGTADIVLDACVDFYDGKELHSLSSADRKKVQDFYQRTSLTAYCTAFAYRPLPEVSSVSDKLTQVYLELPADSNHLYAPHRSPTPLHWPSALLEHCQSADSLFTNNSYEENINDIDGCFRIQCNQIFIGMVTMQYQAQTDMVQLIDQLERACIRFVHFSKENELRSRVFSEKMGLESGWNCHISLLSERTGNSDNVKKSAVSPSTDPEDSDLRPLLADHRSTLSGSRAMSMSAPCAINLEHRASDTYPVFDEEGQLDMNHGEAWQSLSCLTDSTEQSAPVNFDMSNRAKLPRGIDKIRPHLEMVDNVPLLVSLFTDCTVSTTREMIHIMQEYGEIVCVMGSSANADNNGIFLQANASFAVQPLFPQVCQKVSVYTDTLPEQGLSPVSLSNQLNSLPCSVQDPQSIFLLLMEARHFMTCWWNCVQYWVCCVLTLSTVQLLTCMFLLPPILTTGQVLWLSVVIIPLLSLSLVSSRTDPLAMQRATNKTHTAFNSELAVFVVWCYGAKFLVTLVVTPFVFAMTLALYCSHLSPSTYALSTPHSCVTQLLSLPQGERWGGWARFPHKLSSAQQAAALLFVVHLVTISASFVHREHLSWRRSPHKNSLWLFTVFVIVVLQTGYTLLMLGWETAAATDGTESISWSQLPRPVVIVLVLSPVLVFLVNELVKLQEIKANERYQKRARLDFGTKLGMNSPF